MGHAAEGDPTFEVDRRAPVRAGERVSGLHCSWAAAGDFCGGGGETRLDATPCALCIADCSASLARSTPRAPPAVLRPRASPAPRKRSPPAGASNSVDAGDGA